jgi:hypothetical protein
MLVTTFRTRARPCFKNAGATSSEWLALSNKHIKSWKKNRGSFCIAPGSSNKYYRVKESGKTVHFHVIPVKKPKLLRRWLAALKRLSPRMGSGQRVCSDHFIEADYIEEGAFAVPPIA